MLGKSHLITRPSLRKRSPYASAFLTIITVKYIPDCFKPGLAIGCQRTRPLEIGYCDSPGIRDRAGFRQTQPQVPIFAEGIDFAKPFAFCNDFLVCAMTVMS